MGKSALDQELLSFYIARSLQVYIAAWVQLQLIYNSDLLYPHPMNDEQVPGEQPTKKVKTDHSELQQIKNFSMVVADTGEFNLIQKYKPTDSTTNPSLILQAIQKPEFQNMISKSVEFGIKNFHIYLSKSKKKLKEAPPPVNWNELEQYDRQQLINLIFDHLAVSFGCQILKIIPGFVSTEVDPKVSFDIKESVNRAKRLIQLYKNQGADPSRVLIKLASTWEGIKAAETLKKDKIKCNMTLVFHKIQAIACARSKLFLVSPFVGRILDWHKKQTGLGYENPAEDPGVVSVTEIYNYFKKFGYETIVMGASFRNVGEIKELTGCDKLTISPKFLEQLNSFYDDVQRKLDPVKAKELDIEEIQINEPIFRYELNKSKMATDLLSAGIRKFQQDGDKLKEIIRKNLEEGGNKNGTTMNAESAENAENAGNTQNKEEQKKQ